MLAVCYSKVLSGVLIQVGSSNRDTNQRILNTKSKQELPHHYACCMQFYTPERNLAHIHSVLN